MLGGRVHLVIHLRSGVGSQVGEDLLETFRWPSLLGLFTLHGATQGPSSLLGGGGPAGGEKVRAKPVPKEESDGARRRIHEMTTARVSRDQVRKQND